MAKQKALVVKEVENKTDPEVSVTEKKPGRSGLQAPKKN